jgi:hypothetical protein
VCAVVVVVVGVVVRGARKMERWRGREKVEAEGRSFEGDKEVPVSCAPP